MTQGLSQAITAFYSAGDNIRNNGSTRQAQGLLGKKYPNVLKVSLPGFYLTLTQN
jgi:hypothetical protein